MVTNATDKHGHYFRDVSHLTKIDVYRIIELFGVTCPVAQHVLKKALAVGQRGHKDTQRDWQDIIDSAQRWQDMREEDNEGFQVNEFKLVPMEPTEAMIDAAADAHMIFGDMDIALRMAILASPAVQGEPVGWQPIETAPHGEEVLLGWLEWDGAWKIEVSQASWGWSTKTASNISRHGQATHWMPLTDAPQSSELLSSNPRPLSSKSSEPVGEAGSLPGTSGFTTAVFESRKVPVGTKLYATPPTAEQPPAPDVSGVVEALHSAYHLIANHAGEALPDGKTCGDCIHCRLCCAIYGHIPADEVCDWSPSRFKEESPEEPSHDHLRELAEGVKHWGNSVADAWPSDPDFDDSWTAGAVDEDGNKYPVIEVDAGQYDAPGDSEKLARFFTAANPATVLVLLDEIEALQAECEKLRKDATLSGLPDSIPMEPYQTVDRGSPHYKAGWNACRRAMLAAAPAGQGEPVAWHPIDTVPKDGTNVLLWTPAGIIEAHYRKCLYCDDWWHDWQISVVDAYSEHVSLESQPTHWMPLLDAPGAPAVQGEPVVPEGFRLIAVNETFDSLTFWLDRCEQKGHLENCADLVEPWESFEYREVEAPQPEPDVASLVEGMSVSVDVSTGDDDAGNRYFGTVTEAMDHEEGKCGLMLLVQDAEPNFKVPHVSELVEALERVMYCNEIKFLPEDVQQAVSDALSAHHHRETKT